MLWHVSFTKVFSTGLRKPVISLNVLSMHILLNHLLHQQQRCTISVDHSDSPRWQQSLFGHLSFSWRCAEQILEGAGRNGHGNRSDLWGRWNSQWLHSTSVQLLISMGARTERGDLIASHCFDVTGKTRMCKWPIDYVACFHLQRYSAMAWRISSSHSTFFVYLSCKINNSTNRRGANNPKNHRESPCGQQSSFGHLSLSWPAYWTDSGTNMV